MNLRQDFVDLIGVVCVSGLMVFVVLAFAFFIRGVAVNILAPSGRDDDGE